MIRVEDKMVCIGARQRLGDRARSWYFAFGRPDADSRRELKVSVWRQGWRFGAGVGVVWMDREGRLGVFGPWVRRW